MSVRLSELAKDLGTTKKELFEKLPALGFELKKSVVDIDDALATQIKDAIKKSGARFEPPPKKAPPARPPRPKKPAPLAHTAEEKRALAAARVEVPTAVEPETLSVAAAVRPLEPKAPALPLLAPAAIAPPRPTPLRAPSEIPRPMPARPGEVARTPGAAVAATVPAPRPPEPTPFRREPFRPVRPYPGPPAARPVVPGEPGRPESPRTQPKAPRPTSPRPMTGRGGFRRSSGGGADRTSDTRSDSRPSSFMPVSSGPLKPATLSEAVTVKELCEKLNLKSRDVIRRLMDRGMFVTINQSLDREVAIQLAKDFGFDAKVVSFEEESTLQEVAGETTADLFTRPPVVTVMGHVDHGKTTLLDAIRETNVAAREAGQITQHIGAYQVEKKNRRITFLDTPGHEAFTMMRARGAKITDIVILVVAADDGVMPQTIEAIHHAKAAGVPILVAINKIDLPNSNPDRVKQMLSDQGLQPEDWGGDTVMVAISAKKRQGLEELLDLVLLVADMQDLKANPARAASGVVIEAKLDRGRGPVADVLVQTGTLRPGDPFIAGAIYGKVRAMFDDRGHRLEEAGPASPVEVLGLHGVPKAGDPFQVVSEDWKARQIGSFRQAQAREANLSKSSRLSLDQLYRQIADGQVRELPIVLKADVQGSVEALSDMLQKLSTDKTKVRIMHSGTGAITETDVLLGSASNAVVIGFNVRPERKARDLAEQEKVDLRLHTIIYNVTDEIRAAMQGMLEPTYKEVTLGRAEVRQVFRIPKVGTVAGSMVQEGRITRDSQVRLLRDNVVVYEGKLQSLRRFKEDASEVRSGYECGLSIANYQDLKEGDVIEAFKVEKVQTTA